MPKKSNTSKDLKLDAIIPVTKGAVLDRPGPPLKEMKVELGKALKLNVSLDDFIIPAEIANKIVVDHFVLSTTNPLIVNKGSLTAGNLGPGATYSSDGLTNLAGGSSVNLLLNKMNFKPAFIQFQVSSMPMALDNGFIVNIFNEDEYPRTIRFRGLQNNGYEKKYYLSFFLNQLDKGDMPHRLIILNRPFNILSSNWSFFKIKVFILETQL